MIASVLGDLSDLGDRDGRVGCRNEPADWLDLENDDL